jgi:hypothetical protein
MMKGSGEEVVRVRRGGPVEERGNVRIYYGEVYVAVLSRGGQVCWF